MYSRFGYVSEACALESRMRKEHSSKSHTNFGRFTNAKTYRSKSL